MHCFCIIPRHFWGGQCFLFSLQGILSPLLQNYDSGSSPGAMSILPCSPGRQSFYCFTWETLELHLLENLGQTCFSELVPGKAGRVWGSGQRRVDVPGLPPTATRPLAPPFPTFSKENQSFCKAFGKYRYSSKAGTTQEIAWAKSPCGYFDTDRGITGGWKWPCRPIALSLNAGMSRFPQAKFAHT